MDNWLNYGASIPQHATCNNLNEPEGNYGELVKKNQSQKVTFCKIPFMYHLCNI